MVYMTGHLRENWQSMERLKQKRQHFHLLCLFGPNGIGKYFWITWLTAQITNNHKYSAIHGYLFHSHPWRRREYPLTIAIEHSAILSRSNELHVLTIDDLARLHMRCFGDRS